MEVALALKAIDYHRVDLLPLSQVLIGPLRYGGTTVPGMRLDGERIVGPRPIMRRLDTLVAEPALLPAPDDPLYETVLEAERRGDEVVQRLPRRSRPADRQQHPPAHEHRGLATADRGPPGRRLMRYFPPMVGEIEQGALPAEWLSTTASA